MKSYIITVAKNFLANHPKKGQPTNFEAQVISGLKKHTIRGNHAYWERIVNEVNAGNGVLKVRQWSGKPYRSGQIEICQFTKLGIEKVVFKKSSSRKINPVALLKIGNDTFFDKKQLVEVAKNDGFDDLQDFIDWFPMEFAGCIIYFNDFKYSPHT